MQSEELTEPTVLYLSFFKSLSATTAESRDAGERHSSIIRTEGWHSRDDFAMEFFREPAEGGLPIDLEGNGVYTIKKELINQRIS